MRSFGKTLVALGMGALGIACSSASAANLMNNGSFEDPVIGYPYYSAVTPTGWTKGGSAGDASIWRVGYVDSGGNVTVAGEGSQFVTMGGGYASTGTTTWSQTVSGLDIGQAYQLDFKVAGEGSCCGSQSVFVDFVGSNTPGQTFTAASPSANYWKTWVQEGMLFNADASSVTVRFTYTGQYDMGLDDVQLAAAVPEPATYAMLALGLAGLGVVARRRRN
jgi:hypothetical protein